MLPFLLIACAEHIVFDTPIPDDGTFPRAEPTAEALARYQAAAAFSAEAGGRAVMVLQGGSVVFEDYQNGHGAEEPAELFSGTKSFNCAMALAAIEEGLLDLDESAADTLTEWAEDPDKSKITPRHLLQFTSGLKADQRMLTFDGMRTDQKIADKYAYAIDQPLETEPGEVFEYNGTHLLAFGALMARKTGQDPVAYLEAKIFEPITFRYAGWNRDTVGNPMLAFGAWTTANEWAKYGELVLHDGAWDGVQVLPAGAFNQCFQGSEPMPSYGLTFWLNNELTADQAELVPAKGVVGGERTFIHGPADMVTAAGAHDQRLYIVPSMDLVVVRLSDGSRKWLDSEFLGLLFGE